VLRMQQALIQLNSLPALADTLKTRLEESEYERSSLTQQLGSLSLPVSLSLYNHSTTSPASHSSLVLNSCSVYWLY
jgi:hypothetical protein